LALDNGDCASPFPFDQRLFGNVSGVRAIDEPMVNAQSQGGDNCDIGAYEYGATNLNQDQDFDNIDDADDDCPSHYNPNQDQVCKLGQEEDSFCFPIKTPSGAVAVPCL